MYVKYWFLNKLNKENVFNISNFIVKCVPNSTNDVCQMFQTVWNIPKIQEEQYVLYNYVPI